MASTFELRTVRHLVVYLLLLLRLSSLTNALQAVAGSPCESVCSDDDAGTLTDDVVCLDSSYRSETTGRNYQKCVGCLLNSTAVDTAQNQSDVQWGLLDLRYTLSNCMFAIPEERVSISSPCQVSCAPLNASIGYEFFNNNTDISPSYEFCTAAPFDDVVINNCAFCYSFIPQQLFMANFLQALHIACRAVPAAGKPFFPDADSIFNETLIAGPAAASNKGSSNSGLHGYKLALAIALPIAGGLALLALGCWGCFVFTRKRRRRMASSGRMSRVHNAHHIDSSSGTPISSKWEAWGQTEPPREMNEMSPENHNRQHPSPGLAQTRWTQHLQPSPVRDSHHEQGTPLRSSFQRDDVGPGEGQVQDPNLHEQYFGIADGGEDLPGPSSTNAAGLGVYDAREEAEHLDHHQYQYPQPQQHQHQHQQQPQAWSEEEERYWAR